MHPLPGRPARMVLVEARKGTCKGTTVIEPPIVIHDPPSAYTEQVGLILEGSFDLSAGTAPRP